MLVPNVQEFLFLIFNIHKVRCASALYNCKGFGTHHHAGSKSPGVLMLVPKVNELIQKFIWDVYNCKYIATPHRPPTLPLPLPLPSLSIFLRA